jgi:hypothetical protein
MTKIIGKPYAGKLHVRFDEGAGKAAASSRSTLLVKNERLKVDLIYAVEHNLILPGDFQFSSSTPDH